MSAIYVNNNKMQNTLKEIIAGDFPESDGIK